MSNNNSNSYNCKIISSFSCKNSGINNNLSRINNNLSRNNNNLNKCNNLSSNHNRIKRLNLLN